MAAKDLGASLFLPNDARWPLDRTARRIEIDEFVADEAMTNLFLLGLKDMMEVKLKGKDDPEEDWYSFYNLSAVHGYPNEMWRGVPNTKSGMADDGFYCAHSSNVFPTWHRLYIHMFEQAVFRRMQKIAAQFKDDLKTAHDEALKRFRFPYWDPCLPRNELTTPQQPIREMFDAPLLLKTARVWVITPDGIPRRIHNPLMSYKYPTPDQYTSSKRPLINWSDKSEGADNIHTIKETGHVATLRSPTEDGVTSYERFQATLQQRYASLSSGLFTLLHPDSVGGSEVWEVFANNTSMGKSLSDLKKATISVESWHDNVHGYVGAGASSGHMASLAVAAFDPLFWLHHCNTDRLFALYQAMYEHEPNKFVADDDIDPEAFVATTPLSPFVKYQRGKTVRYYDSYDAQDWTGLGFAVPGNKHLTDQAGRDSIAQYLMEVYAWSADATVRPKETLGYPRETRSYFALSGSDFDIEAKQEVSFLAIEDGRLVKEVFECSGKLKSEEPFDVRFQLPMDQFPDRTFVSTTNAQSYTWSVLMNVRKYAFNASFFVQLFIGMGKVPPSEKGCDYLQDSRLAGSSTIFAFSSQSDCQNCRTKADMIYSDVIGITPKLREFLQGNNAPDDTWPPKSERTLRSLSPTDVVPFLKAQLEWRIVSPDGKVADADQVTAAGLKLLVADSLYTYPVAGNNVGPAGKYSEWHYHEEVTSGKVGGCPLD